MAKNSKNKLLFMALLLTVLLVSSAYATLASTVNAAEITAQEKGFAILNEVVGLDMENYDTASKEGAQDSYLGVVPQENVRYTLESNGSKIDALYTFANGKLRMVNVLENEGSPRLTKSATKPVQLGNKTIQVIDVPETAKVFLEDYQTYSGNPFYGDLASMLENVEANENLTKTVGNVKLEVTVSEGSTVFRWTYTINGIDAPSKCVAIGYKNGFLKYFIDNWDLYKIGSTTVNISEQEAIDIAMERARGFSWNMGSDNESVKISGFTVTNAMIWENVFCSNMYADTPRSEDPLMLYPMRHVWVSLDKFYPGNVYGFNVYVWTDTGEVCYINERVSTLDPPTDLIATDADFTVESINNKALVEIAKSNSLPFTWIVLFAFTIVMLGTVPVWLLRNRSLLKRPVKIGGILLCILSSSILLMPVWTVGAVEYTRRALIWGSESTGDTSFWNGSAWVTGRKTADEIYRQRVTSNAIKNYFIDDGYDTDNYQGTGSIKAQILYNISNAEANYNNVAVVDFDHGVGNTNMTGIPVNEFHYMFEDNEGTKIDGEWDVDKGVYDYEVYKETSGDTFFAFINTCMSACIDDTVGDYNSTQGIVNPNDPPQNQRARGMPFAWTHRLVTENPTTTPPSGYMSCNGYTHPDGDIHCYIGCPAGSAALDQTITGVSPLYATWLENFFWYALSFDISVNAALDEASLRNFDCLFGETDLATGFTAIWPQYFDGYWHYSGPGVSGPGTLAVYGNGNVHLYEYFVHDYVDATWYGYYAGVDNPDGIEGGSNDDSYAVLYAIGWYGDQAVIFGSIGWEATGHIYLYGLTDYGYNSHVLVYVSNTWGNWENWDAVNENLWVSQTSPGWIDVGTYAGKFRYIAVVVYADQAPSILAVDSVLVIPSPPQSEQYWVYEADKYEDGGTVYDLDYINGSYHDGNSATIYAPDYPDRADIIGTLNEEVVGGGHVYIYGCSYPGGYLSDMYVYVSSNYQDWYQVGSMMTITATSPYWIDVGTYGSSFRYVRIVGYDSHNSVRLVLDCVRVT
ncbi:hypothetical protein JXA31_01060 [Candidatus Bathyarchaeota archaeon]|nr:hypothetical protein [Candidatus Bathyarchaeota archaeon]